MTRKAKLESRQMHWFSQHRLGSSRMISSQKDSNSHFAWSFDCLAKSKEFSFFARQVAPFTFILSSCRLGLSSNNSVVTTVMLADSRSFIKASTVCKTTALHLAHANKFWKWKKAACNHQIDKKPTTSFHQTWQIPVTPKHNFYFSQVFPR